MRIHLIKSAEVDATLFTKVVDFLQSVPGPISFSYNHNDMVYFEDEEVFKYLIRDEDHFSEKIMSRPSETKESELRSFPMERETVTWDVLFNKVANYRAKKKIDKHEFIILLTDIANKQNWFAVLDEKMPYNGFIHTADWDYYINCSAAFPIAYEVIALALQKHMFDGFYHLRSRVHQHPIGCINDFCSHKRDIILKLRTGDVCEDCIDLSYGKINPSEMNHALHIMSSLREKMLFAQNKKRFSSLSKLVVDNRNKIFLTDFGNIEIKLRPLEKALYFLFLRHPEGIYHSSLSDYRMELYEIYAAISTRGDLIEMRERIDDMVNALSNSASEKISKIKKAFEDAIGLDLAKHYYIQGEPGQLKKINLDRSLLQSS